jgi:hypothetical protein
MRKLGFLTLIPLSAGVIGLTVGALWLVGSSSGQRERFSSLEIAPADPVFYMAINTEPSSSQWIAVSDVLGTLNAKEPLRDAIDEELLKFGLEFERDILPLAGDEGYLAITDVDALSNNTGGFVIAFRLSDVDKAEQIALDVAEQEGTEFSEEEYEGVTIRESDNLSEGDPGAIAFVENVMVVGVTREDVKGVIDVVHGRAPNAVTDERLRELRERQEEDFLFWGYADMAPIWDTAESSIPTDFGGSGSSDPIETPPPGPPVETDFSVLSFDAEYSVNNGALEVTERIVVDFGQTPKHGIFRDIATRITYDLLDDVVVSVEPRSVTRDGNSEPFEQPPIEGPFHRLVVGDPGVTITGQHTYVIKYVVRGAIINVDSGDGDAYYDIVWNVTGDNWGVPIETATATLTIPNGSFMYTPCAVGPDPFPAFQSGCSTTQEGITTVRYVSDGPIEAGSGMAFMASVSGVSGAPDAELVPSEGFPFETDETPTDEFPFAFDYPEIFDELRGTYDRVAFSVSSTGDGFALDATVLHAPGFEPKYAAVPTKAFDSRFAGSLPPETMFFFAGNDPYNEGYLSRQDEFLDTPGPGGQTIRDVLDEIERELGFDLEADLLALMTGEVAIAGNVSNISTGGLPEFEVLALAEVNDAARMENTMRKLGDYLEQQDIATVEDSNREGVHRWLLTQTPDSVAWTVNDGDVILGYPESAVTSVQDRGRESLADTGDWKRTMDSLPADRTSLGYISLARVIEEVRQIDGAEADFEQSTEGKLTLDDLAPIRTVAFATTAADDGYSARVIVLIAD